VVIDHSPDPDRPERPCRRQPTELPENQLGQEDDPYAAGSVADDLELEVVGSVLDIDPVDERGGSRSLSRGRTKPMLGMTDCSRRGTVIGGENTSRLID
jgi:hypothetical protein